MPSANQTVPNGWPAGLIYLSKPSYSPNVSSNLLTHTTSSPNQGVISSSTEPVLEVLPSRSVVSPSPLVRIVPISDPSHPACGQNGLFAAQPLPAGSFILCYLGWTHDSRETDPTSSYDLSLDRELDVAVDATRMGNEARFINDYRGVRESGPNAEFRDVLVRVGKGQAERRVGVYVKTEGKGRSKGKSRDGPSVKQKKSQASGIAKGDEIVVSYGKGFWQHHDAVANANAEKDPREQSLD